MGYYASAAWDLRFKDQAAHDTYLTQRKVEDPMLRDVVDVLAQCHEDVDGDLVDDDGTPAVEAWGSGKYYADDDFFTALAPHLAEGSVEIRGEDDVLQRIIFKDGDWFDEAGWIAYPSDTLWTLTVVVDGQITTTLHDTEKGAHEALRVNFGDQPVPHSIDEHKLKDCDSSKGNVPHRPEVLG